MNTEYEVRVLEIDVDKIINKITDLGGKFVGEYYQRRYIYDFNPVIEGKWIRLRTNGIETTLTIKNRFNDKKIDGTLELEEVVEDFDKTNLILNELGYKARAYQENKRVRYELNGVELDIDSWPLIPTYLEIEGSSVEEVEKYIKLLEVEDLTITSEGVNKVYNRYNIDLESIEILKFEGEDENGTK